MALVVIAVFVALGTWQVERLAWKRDLIARVDARIHAAPVAIPARAAWDNVTAASDEYRRVTAAGTYLAGQTVLVQAVTVHGAGFWVMTPLRLSDARIVFVNRGFVPTDGRNPAGWRPLPSDGSTVTGLLRLTEPGGGFLRRNDPAQNRWYSRDTFAMAAAKGLDDVAPFFIDAEAEPGETGLPIAGLTVVAFPNNHLVYALTWYGMAASLAIAAFVALRRR